MFHWRWDSEIMFCYYPFHVTMGSVHWLLGEVRPWKKYFFPWDHCGTLCWPCLFNPPVDEWPVWYTGSRLDLPVILTFSAIYFPGQLFVSFTFHLWLIGLIITLTRKQKSSFTQYWGKKQTLLAGLWQWWNHKLQWMQHKVRHCCWLKCQQQQMRKRQWWQMGGDGGWDDSNCHCKVQQQLTMVALRQ